MFWIPTLIFLGISALLCSVGFKKFVYFLSIGYGFAVAGLGISYSIYSFINNSWDIIGLVFSLLLVVYGARLSVFLIAREVKSLSYRRVLNEVTDNGQKKIPFFVLLCIWISCSLLYFAQTCPVFYRGANIAGNMDLLLRFSNFSSINWNSLICPIIGIFFSLFGLIIESLADAQKTAQKKINPNMVATKQLYKFVRCPNYFGEILFWTGIFVGGCQAYNHWGQWLVAILGYICIVYVMINSAQRLAKKQETRYGDKEEYREYADNTSLLIPFISFSHIRKKK